MYYHKAVEEMRKSFAVKARFTSWREGEYAFWGLPSVSGNYHPPVFDSEGCNPKVTSGDLAAIIGDYYCTEGVICKKTSHNGIIVGYHPSTEELLLGNWEIIKTESEE